MIDSYVTGASGFIGKNLVTKLQGETIPIPHERISDFQFCDHHNFFFLSTYGNMAHHESVPHKVIKSNVGDVVKILGDILRFGINCDFFCYVSSSSVNLPVQTTYSRTKLAAEFLVMSKPLNGCVVRPFSVIGKGEQKEHLIPTLIRSCLEGEQMDFCPEATHDYVDVDDLTDGMLLLAEQKMKGIYEFGRGIAITNQTVRGIVESVTGKKANIGMVKSLRNYDNSDWRCKGNIPFGWRPKKSLRQSIEEMVEAYAK